MSGTLDHLSAVYGDQVGWVFVGVGRGGHWTDGKYRHSDWSEDPYRWPAQADEIISVITDAAPAGDVYFTPGLSANPVRQKFKNPRHARRPQPTWCLWADLDHGWDRGRLSRLGDAVGLVSGSSDDRRHLYVPLVEPSAPEVTEDLLALLAAWLGADASTWHGTYLRPAGTLNHKTAPPTQIEVLAWPDRAVWSVGALNALLPAVPRSCRWSGTTVPEAEAVGELPRHLAELVAERCEPGARSERTFTVVRVLAAAGLSDGQIVAVMRQHHPTVEKYGRRADHEVARAIGKIREPLGRRTHGQ